MLYRFMYVFYMYIWHGLHVYVCVMRDKTFHLYYMYMYYISNTQIYIILTHALHMCNIHRHTGIHAMYNRRHF